VPIEVHAEDQYAVVSGDVTLTELAAALPPGLHYRAPDHSLTVDEWLRAGGVGHLSAPPARADVLGLTYERGGEPVEVGGRVVKNVAGYDLTRLVVGSDQSLTGDLRVLSANLRLRPRPTIVIREVTAADTDDGWVELRALRAAFAVAAHTEDRWRVQATWWGEAPAWGSPVGAPFPWPGEWVDARGPFPRAQREPSELERRVLEAL
jgi:FAD/FMN-containing dehydrogenase